MMIEEEREDLPSGARRYEGFDELYCSHNGFCPYQGFIEINEQGKGYIPICRFLKRKVIDDILIKVNKEFRSLEKACENETENQS